MSPPRLVLRDPAWIERASLIRDEVIGPPPVRTTPSMSDVCARVRAMVVFSNRRLGPAAEIAVSPDVGSSMLRSTAEAARPLAQSRWEHELVVWLEDRSRRFGGDLDVSDLAWSPDNFERQRAFVTGAIERAAIASPHGRALARWARQIADHPRESVVVGRRWQWTTQHATT